MLNKRIQNLNNNFLECLLKRNNQFIKLNINYVFCTLCKTKEKIPAMYKVSPVNLLNPNDVVLCKNMYKMPNIMSSELPSFNDYEVKNNKLLL